MAWEAEREAVARTARRMADLGLAVGVEGNVSLRVPLDKDGRTWGLAITPRAKDYASLTAEQVVVLDANLDPLEGSLLPSSEALLHREVYQARPDVGAVVHTHSPWATALAVAGRELLPILDETALLVGGPVRVAGYAFSGSEELARNAVDALGDRGAVLLRHHGVLAVGPDLRTALDTALAVERSAQVYILARLLGDVPSLPPEGLALALEVYRMRRLSPPREPS